MIIRILLIAGMAAVISVTLKKNTPEFALLAVICAGIIILIQLISPLKDIYTRYKDLISFEVIDIVTKPVIKIVGISILSKVAAEFCRDCSESSLAVKAELAGTLGCIAAALPVIQYTLDIIDGLI